MTSKIRQFLIFLLLINYNLYAEDMQLEEIFKKNKIEGTIVLESLNTKEKFVYNENRANLLLSPASTFKIVNTLISLKEKVVNEKSLIVWDKKDRGVSVWNKDQTLQTAFKYSCVWCYQDFAEKIGLEKYNTYLKELNYGNKTLGNDVRDFWLDASLKITPMEQITFLEKLYKNDLPFEMEHIKILKKIMIEDKTQEYTLRAKSGWSTRFEFESGWYVGYLELKNDVWFFATNLITNGQKDLPLRKEITLEALKVKNIIK